MRMNKQEIEDAISELNDLANTKALSSSAFGVVHGRSLRLAISALEKQLNGVWISVSERRPIKSGRYLTIYHEWSDGNYLPKYDETYVKILRYREAIFRLPVCIDKKAEQDTHREVLAWMPLPELPQPYREDGESHD
jgi:hypothetical protein